MSEMRVIALGGGKGGVGKSFVAVNLAVSLAKSGKRVIMLDADFGGANLHALFGVLRPERTVADYVAGRAASLADVAIQTSVPRLSILAGTCDVLGSADAAGAQKKALLEGIASLDCDVLVIDVGAGSTTHTVDLFNAADTRLVVLTPELTSVQNAYGFLKIAAYRRLSRVVEGHPAEARLKEAMGEDAFEIGSTMKKVDTFISLVADEAPELEEPFRLLLAEMNVKLVGNMLQSENDRNTVWAIKRMVANFLGVDAEVAAAFRANTKVRRTVNTGVPLTARADADGYDVAEFTRLAKLVADQDFGPINAIRDEINASLRAAESEIVFGLDGIDIDIDLVEVTDSVSIPAVRAFEPTPNITVPVPPRDRQGSGVRPAVTSRPPQARQSPPPPPPRALPNPSFVGELERVTRRSSRGEVNVEVELMGHWFFGKLTTVDETNLVVRGVHPFAPLDGKTCRMRLVHMRLEDEELTVPTSVVWRAYDEGTGQATLEFVDPAMSRRLVEYVQAALGHRRAA